jgi:hypothetical protein
VEHLCGVQSTERCRVALVLFPARRLHESLVTVEAAYGERREGRFGRRNETVSRPGYYVESCTPELPNQMLKLHTPHCEL